LIFYLEKYIVFYIDIFLRRNFNMSNEEFQKLVIKKLSSMEKRQDEIYQVVRAIEHSNNAGRAELDEHNFRLAKNEGTLKKIGKVIDEEMNKVSSL
jgi:hypothetical protein